MKRLFDMCTASILFVLLFPITAVVWILVASKLGRPVLFRQQRPGLEGKLFYIYKFRTMTADRDPLGELLPDEDRLTLLGRTLRRFSLDELPQLFNVIIGDLSLVGPRPLLVQYMNRYTQEQDRRHEVKPGITGWAQVNGRNAISWEKKFELDVWYVDNRSFWLDLKILWLTFRKVICSEGISHRDHATMEEFKG
jgi:sugar transferase EpsL